MKIQTSSPLKRTLSLRSMVFYGLGTIIGAGIYVLIGEITLAANAWAPLAFVIAAAIASFTGLSYAELVSRYPRSAGEAVYIEQAYRTPWLTQAVGWSVVLTGLISAATLLKGFSGYFIALFGGTEWVIISIALVLMCLLACSGVKQSVGVAVTITLLELLGLLIVVIVTADDLIVAKNWQRWVQELNHFSLSGIIAASFLAFYAFIGFEDMVNMAEEVEDASLSLPKAIVLAIAFSTGIYLLIALVAVVVTPVEILGNSKEPLVTLVSSSTWFPVWLMSIISLIAIMNGAIVQLLMAPRVVYGITRHLKCGTVLAHIHPVTQTPIIATLLISLLILLFTLCLPLAQLAKLTSAIILCLFILINCALMKLKKTIPFDGFQVSKYIPLMGALSSSLLLIVQLYIQAS